MFKTVVDWSKCVNHGTCELLAPDVFQIDPDSGQLVLLQSQSDEELLEAVEDAVDRCPTLAISIRRSGSLAEPSAGPF